LEHRFDRQRHLENRIFDLACSIELAPGVEHSRPFQDARALDIDREHTTRAVSLAALWPASLSDCVLTISNASCSS
jgi:hypothetical protein